MKTYIYPENLRATVKLWFLEREGFFIIICGGIILSVIVFVNLWNAAYCGNGLLWILKSEG